MIIWTALIVPILAVIFINYFYRHQITWWECGLPILLSVILIFFMKMGIEKHQTNDKETWTGPVAQAKYDEAWNELETYTETDEDGNTVTKTRVVNHPNIYEVTDNNGIKKRIKKGKFHSLCKQFGNKKFIDMHRSYHTNDGDRYVTKWHNQYEKMEVMTTVHTYENRVQASSSVFKFPEVPEKARERLFDYPDVSGLLKEQIFGVPSILAKIKDIPQFPKANEDLNKLNALFGKQHQIRMWILIFGPETTLEDGMNQEAYWQRGNKNELVICIGKNKENVVQWAHVFSWTEKEQLKIELRDLVLKQEVIDLPQIVGWLKTNVPIKWKRKEFADFSYITVDPPLWSVLLTFFLTILASGGISAYAVLNQYKEDVRLRLGRFH